MKLTVTVLDGGLSVPGVINFNAEDAKERGGKVQERVTGHGTWCTNFLARRLGACCALVFLVFWW